MSLSNNRATRAIVASLSLTAILAIGIPWVDEYRSLCEEADDLIRLGGQANEVRERDQQLRRIETKIVARLSDDQRRSVTAENTEEVRNQLIAIIRESGGRLRNLDIDEGRQRPWAIENDDPHADTIPRFAEESDYILHKHEIEMRVDGSIETLKKVLDGIAKQKWFMRTSNLLMNPTDGKSSTIALELRLLVYGLTPRPEEPDEEFAVRHGRHQSVY